MIGFLYPALALAAFAAAIPVILHLMRRREARRLSFPAIRYLRQAEQRHARRLRLRHLLLLAARVSIIVVAAVAAAGPLIGRGGPRDHRPTALAIVIDESQSSAQVVGERRLLDLLVERAALALDLLHPDDRIALFNATDPDRGSVTSDPAAARGHLQALQPNAGLARLPDAVRKAAAWLSSMSDRARELHILTDMQRVSLTTHAEATAADSDRGAGISVVVYSPDHEPQPNGAIGRLSPEVEPLSAGQETRISVPLHWYGSEPPSEPVVIRLVEGDDVISVAEGRFDAVTLVRLPAQDSGWVRGYVEIARHGLADDDRRYFSWFARPLVRLAVIGEATEFLEHALRALEEGGRLLRTPPAEAQVWVADSGERIEAGLSAGKSVIVIPPETSLELPRLNLRLSRARVPWRYEPAAGRQQGSTRIAEGAGIEGLAGLAVHQFFRLVPAGLAAGDTALVRLAEGDAWLVGGTASEGVHYLLLASPLTPASSDIPVSAAMVPFIDALVGGWARRSSVEGTPLAGTATRLLPARAREVRLPDGSRTPAEGGAWFRPSRAGNYTISDGAADLSAFAVNAPLIEADLKRGSREELARTLPAADWTWTAAPEPGSWQTRIFRARRGRLTWRPLVVLLLLISIVEATLAAAGRRKPAQPAAAGEND